MKIKILSLFPKMFEGFLHESIVKRAIEKKIAEVELIDIRTYSLEKHHHVDDTPYGGGAGMVLAVDVVHRALKANCSEKSYKILLSPQGTPYHQKKAFELSSKEELVLICGHYEGFDERILKYVDEEISIGDYVLTGGELPAMVLTDSVIRLLEDAIKKESFMDDSFSTGLLEYPQYTRPLIYDGDEVPEVLVNGNHKQIEAFRKKESLRKTYLRRPDLLEKYVLMPEEQKLLDEIKKEEQR